jgi:hypothetical protein
VVNAIAQFINFFAKTQKKFLSALESKKEATSEKNK